MKLQLLNTPLGLKPCYEDDFDEAKKLKIGAVYEADIKLQRNPRFHRLFMCLIKIGYAYLPGEIQDRYFKSSEGFRKSVIIAAGFTRVYYNIRKQSFEEEAESISFASMDEAKFRDVYDRCKDVIFSLISKYVTLKEFEQNLSQFYQ